MCHACSRDVRASWPTCSRALLAFLPQVSRAIRALVPHVSCAIRALFLDVPHDIRALVPYVLHALRSLAPHVLRTLFALVPYVFYVLLYLTCLEPCVFSCYSCLVPYVLFCSSSPTCFRCFKPNILILQLLILLIAAFNTWKLTDLFVGTKIFSCHMFWKLINYWGFFQLQLNNMLVNQIKWLNLVKIQRLKEDLKNSISKFRQPYKLDDKLCCYS